MLVSNNQLVFKVVADINAALPEAFLNAKNSIHGFKIC
jgi:hypothetical protein